jgi:hypothetical protein
LPCSCTPLTRCRSVSCCVTLQGSELTARLLSLSGLSLASPFLLGGAAAAAASGGWQLLRRSVVPPTLPAAVPHGLLAAIADAATACGAVGSSPRSHTDATAAAAALGCLSRLACVAPSSFVCPLLTGAAGDAGSWAFLTDGAAARGSGAGATSAASLPVLHGFCDAASLLFSVLEWLHCLCTLPPAEEHQGTAAVHTAAALLCCLRDCRLPPAPLKPLLQVVFDRASVDAGAAAGRVRVAALELAQRHATRDLSLVQWLVSLVDPGSAAAPAPQRGTAAAGVSWTSLGTEERHVLVAAVDVLHTCLPVSRWLQVTDALAARCVGAGAWSDAAVLLRCLQRCCDRVSHSAAAASAATGTATPDGTAAVVASALRPLCTAITTHVTPRLLSAVGPALWHRGHASGDAADAVNALLSCLVHVSTDDVTRCLALDGTSVGGQWPVAALLLAALVSEGVLPPSHAAACRAWSLRPASPLLQLLRRVDDDGGCCAAVATLDRVAACARVLDSPSQRAAWTAALLDAAEALATAAATADVPALWAPWYVLSASLLQWLGDADATATRSGVPVARGGRVWSWRLSAAVVADTSEPHEVSDGRGASRVGAVASTLAAPFVDDVAAHVCDTLWLLAHTLPAAAADGTLPPAALQRVLQLRSVVDASASDAPSRELSRALRFAVCGAPMPSSLHDIVLLVGV